jgi:transposase
VAAIAAELDLSEKTVRNYLSERAETPEKRPANPETMRPEIPRKENRVSQAALGFGGRPEDEADAQEVLF